MGLAKAMTPAMTSTIRHDTDHDIDHDAGHDDGEHSRLDTQSISQLMMLVFLSTCMSLAWSETCYRCPRYDMFGLHGLCLPSTASRQCCRSYLPLQPDQGP